MQAGARHTARTIIALICAATAVQSPALAQDATMAAYASASPPSNPTDGPVPPAESELSPEDSAVLGNVLTFDPATLNNAAPAKPLRVPSLTGRQRLDVSRTDNPDGSSTVILKQPLPIDWDAKVGADLGLAPIAPESYQPGHPLPGLCNDRSSGAAWGSVGVLPNLAMVDARVDPSNDQGRLGTTVKHSMQLGGKFSVTLQNSYSVTETFSASSAVPSDFPLMAAPISPTSPVPQVWGSEKAAKFDILPAGTSFGAKLASISNDPVTHNTLSAEQKLYGPLHVTTALTDVGQQTASKSITAGFKLNW